MKRILTTHVGSLPTLDVDADIGVAVSAVVRRQREIGLDLINEGEYTKGGDWLSYIEERFGGFEPRPAPPGERALIAQGRDREAFADFYRYATERGTLFYAPGEQIKRVRPVWHCTEPVIYRGLASLKREIATLLEFVKPEEAFLTSTAPGSLEVYRRNDYYRSEEEFVYAIAEAMRVEYEAIAASGVMLQVDDAWLPALWDRIGIAMGLPAFLKHCAVRVEALNHALRNVPEERVRYHLCWGSWHGPHAHDLELKIHRRSAPEGESEGLSHRSGERAPRARVRSLGRGEAARREAPGAGRGHAFHRRGRASRAGRAAHPALCEARRCRELDRRSRLRLRRPQPSADRVGEATLLG